MRRVNLRFGCLSLLFFAACWANDGPSGSWRATLEPPADVDQVIVAVSALPECNDLRGGVIHWHAQEFICEGIAATGCAFPFEDPQRIEVVYRGSAWDSSLAHELCHLCGYTVGPAGDKVQLEMEADACSSRAHRARPSLGELP